MTCPMPPTGHLLSLRVLCGDLAVTLWKFLPSRVEISFPTSHLRLLEISKVEFAGGLVVMIRHVHCCSQVQSLSGKWDPISSCYISGPPHPPKMQSYWEFHSHFSARESVSETVVQMKDSCFPLQGDGFSAVWRVCWCLLGR